MREGEFAGSYPIGCVAMNFARQMLQLRWKRAGAGRRAPPQIKKMLFFAIFLRFLCLVFFGTRQRQRELCHQLLCHGWHSVKPLLSVFRPSPRHLANKENPVVIYVLVNLGEDESAETAVNGSRTTWWSSTPGCRRAGKQPKWPRLRKIWSLKFFWLIGKNAVCERSVMPAWAWSSSVNQIAATPCSS